MNASNKPTRSIQFPRLVYRKQIVVPAEHGSWPWLLVPFAVGVGVAGRFNLAVLLTLVGGLAVFLMRQPATVWMRAQRGRARANDGPIAAGWVVALALVGLVCLLGLLALGQAVMLWLTGPFLAVLAVYLIAARYGRSNLRSLWMELAGAVTLSMMAPAAMIAANGRIDNLAWVLWGVMAAQNILGALYVRLRVADSHNRPMKRQPILAGHGVGLLLIVGMGLAKVAPMATAVPFIGFLIRAGWAAARPRPVNNIKQFGFLELGIEIASGLWIIASYGLT